MKKLLPILLLLLLWSCSPQTNNADVAARKSEDSRLRQLKDPGILQQKLPAETVGDISNSGIVLKKYYIVKEWHVRSPGDSFYHNSATLDSIQAGSDTAAYWQGVLAYTASKKEEKKFREKGVKYPQIETIDFNVLDEKFGSIRGLMTHEMRVKANAYTKPYE